MEQSLNTNLVIRQGLEADLAAALDLVKELAVFEEAGDKVTATLEDYQKGFQQDLFEFLVACEDEQIVGLMLYYYTWSTWKGKMMYLEDFVISQSHRRKGIGQKLMGALTNKARNTECRLIKWQVLEWNTTGIQFYEKMGNAVFDKVWWDVKVYLGGR